MPTDRHFQGKLHVKDFSFAGWLQCSLHPNLRPLACPLQTAIVRLELGTWLCQEIYPPEVKDFVYITDNAYTKDDILNMEVYGLAVFCSEGLSNLETIQMLQI